MTELIEAVARAICHDEWTTPGTDLKPEAVARVVDHEWEHWSSVAQAALTAITDAGYRIVPGWQPIETAPKDGTQILAWIGRVGMGHQVLSFYDGRWREPANGLGLKFDPAAWMPLPAAPGDEM